ncbi:hypothetical protein LINPERPRIM_LOCUS41661 [Linum perenne]
MNVGDEQPAVRDWRLVWALLQAAAFGSDRVSPTHRRCCCRHRCSSRRVLSRLDVSTVLHTIRAKNDPVSWSDLVWKRPIIPSHCFLSWMVMVKATVTKDKLCKWGLINDDTCDLCVGFPEDFDHVFSGCDYSRAVLLQLFGKFQPEVNVVSSS